MFQYVMSPTGKLLHESDKYVKAICGPFGSGKSCACAVDVLVNAISQNVAPDGIRYTRIGIIRSTYPELLSTTRKSLLEVFPEPCGGIKESGAPVKGYYEIPLPDKTKARIEIEMFAIDELSIQKIRSCNWTFAWINEATGVDPEVFAMITSRVGRYPSDLMGGIRWGGIILDFNRPDQQNWLYTRTKDVPSNWAYIEQPPAAFQIEDANGQRHYETNPQAENLNNLGSWEEGDPTSFATEDEKEAYKVERGMRFYRNQIETLLMNGREDSVQNLYCMMDVPLIDGKPVYSSFKMGRHVATAELKPVAFEDIVVGMDQSGLHPAAVVLQYQFGKWAVLDELYADGEGFEDFLQGMLLPLLRAKYATNRVTAAIDPSNQRDSFQAITPSARLEEAGIPTVTEISNNPKTRIYAVEQLLNMDTGGLLVSPTCDLLIRGFRSEYRYRRLRARGTIGAAYTPSPEKNDASHVHDALQYAVLFIHQGKDNNDSAMYETASRLSQQRMVLNRVM